LCDGLNDDEEFVRFLSAWALGEVGNFDYPRTISVLESALTSEQSERLLFTIQDSLNKLLNADTD